MASAYGRLIPGEVCSEIFSWLPAKEVARCRSISKAFNASSCDRFFFMLQANHTKDDAGLFLRRHDGRFEMILTDACAGVPVGSLEFLKEDNKRILGSHGGLVLFDSVEEGSDDKFYLYNPARRTLTHLPRPQDVKICSVMTVGIAILFANRHGDGVDYEVVCMTPTSEWSSFMEYLVYSSYEQAWKLIDDRIYIGPRNIKFYSPVVDSHGIIYLASDCGRYQRQEPYIVAVDIKEGTSKILSLPGKVLLRWEDSEIEIAGHEGCLNLVHCNAASEFTIWNLKDRNRWVWEQKGQVSMATMGLKPRPVHGFALINGDTLVFTVEEDVYVYHMKHRGELKVFTGQQGCCPYICCYANTLRPCGRNEVKETGT